MIILDLEDATGPDEKAEARARIDAALAAWSDSGAIRAVRINGLSTPWWSADLRAAARADAIVLPKIEQVGELHEARAALNAHGSHIPIWAMIETPAAIYELPGIAGATGTGLAGLIAGTNDLSKALRCGPDAARTGLVPHLANILLSARACGVHALDGVYNAFRDAEGFREECRQGRALGFDGKTLIHPSQVDGANEIFGPSPEELDQARRIIEAFADPANAAKGVISVDGDMVERLHLDAARALIAAAGGNDR